MLKESKPQSKSPTFINILKHPLLSIILSGLVTVVEVTVTPILDLLVTPDINIVLIRAQIFVLDTMKNPTLKIILHTMIVIDLGMTNLITNILLNHFIPFSRPYYKSTFSRSPSKYYPRSGKRSSSYNNASSKRYNSPYRPPSKPRIDRYRSRSHTNSKQYSNFQHKPSVNLTHPSTPILYNTPSTEPKFEINMCHPTTSLQYSSLSNEHANALTPSTWFVNLYIFKPIEDTSLPSKLEVLFLLDSGASICVLNFSTFTILADPFLKCSQFSPHQDEFKTLTVAKKTEVPMLYNVILTLHTSIHGSTRTLINPFAVANIKYNILGTPFFEKYITTLNIENLHP